MHWRCPCLAVLLPNMLERPAKKRRPDVPNSLLVGPPPLPASPGLKQDELWFSDCVLTNFLSRKSSKTTDYRPLTVSHIRIVMSRGPHSL